MAYWQSDRSSRRSEPFGVTPRKRDDENRKKKGDRYRGNKAPATPESPFKAPPASWVTGHTDVAGTPYIGGPKLVSAEGSGIANRAGTTVAGPRGGSGGGTGGGQTNAFDGFAGRYSTDPNIGGRIFGDPGIVARDYLQEQGYSTGDPLSALLSESAADWADLFFIINGRKPVGQHEIDDFANWAAGFAADSVTPGGRTYNTEFLIDQILNAPNGSPMAELFTGDPDAQLSALTALMGVAGRGVSPHMQQAMANNMDRVLMDYRDNLARGTGSAAGRTAANDWLRQHMAGFY